MKKLGANHQLDEAKSSKLPVLFAFIQTKLIQNF